MRRGTPTASRTAPTAIRASRASRAGQAGPRAVAGLWVWELLAESATFGNALPGAAGEAERAFSKTTPVKACGSGPRCATAARPCLDGRRFDHSGRAFGRGRLLGDREAAFFLETTGVSGDCGTADEFGRTSTGGLQVEEWIMGRGPAEAAAGAEYFRQRAPRALPCSTKGLDP